MKFMYDFQRATKIVGIKKRKKNQTKVNKFIKTSNNKKKKKMGMKEFEIRKKNPKLKKKML